RPVDVLRQRGCCGRKPRPRLRRVRVARGRVHEGAGSAAAEAGPRVTPRVCAVLRTGGEYRTEHAQRLAAQVARFAPGAEFFVLSNVEVPGVQTLLCEHHYKGWWQKIEMMKPSIRGNLLMFDLDTTIVGSLDDMLARTALTMTADFYSLRKLQSPVMFLTEEARARAWEEWCRIGPVGARLAHTG